MKLNKTVLAALLIGSNICGETGVKRHTVIQRLKIDVILKSQDLFLKDVVSMRVYLVGIPAQGGAMDFPEIEVIASKGK